MSRVFKVNGVLGAFQELELDESYIYKLISEDDSCLYVGQTKNLQQRIYQHLADGKEFYKVELDTCPSNIANDREADAIVDSQPKLNKRLPSTSKYIRVSALKTKVIKAFEANKDELDIVFSGTNMHGVSSQYMTSEGADKVISMINKKLFGIGE